jgi:hypothetical protein
MPNWKKVILSGSAASLSSLNVANAITASGFSGDGSNITNISVAELATVSDSFTNVTNVTSTHNFGTKDVMVSVYNSSDEMIIPGSITTNLNTVVATFDIATTGRIVVAKGGHIVSGSTLTYRESITGASSYAITHSLDEDYPIVQVYDTGKSQVIPGDITSTSANALDITFDNSFTGTVVVKK